MNRWRKSTYCSGGDCVEIGAAGAGAVVRDSKDPGGAVLAFAAASWERFTARLRQGAA